MIGSARVLAALAFAVLVAAPAVAEPMTFRLADIGDPARCKTRCTQVIVAEGEIAERTPQDFTAFVRAQLRNPNARGVIFLHSPGGRVVAAMQLGHLFRRAGAAVVVARVDGEGMKTARCYSACVYALMGAKKRVIPTGSSVGIHRMFTYERFGGFGQESPMETRIYAQSDLVSRLGDYAGMMGVSPELVYTAEKVSPDRVHIVSPQEIRRWRLGSDKF
ncbi:MAG TPA: hypothetical protein VIL72_06710 [Beijerinckiaceae bacterium]|jgi:hypothetical protein